MIQIKRVVILIVARSFFSLKFIKDVNIETFIKGPNGFESYFSEAVPRAL